MPDESPRKPEPAQPRIWAEGSQKPKFQLRPFAVASLHLTRHAVAPLIARSATETARFSTRVAEGTWRVPTARLGRAERLVPSHQSVAAWIAAGARILDAAGCTAAPEALRRRDRFARTAPAQPVPAMQAALVTRAEPGSEDAATLNAIRSVLGDATVAPTPGPAARPSRLAASLVSATGAALGWGMTLLALPYGIARATIAHLNGEDLRSIRDDG